MTNGRGAGMASFMTKKKKYKFQVDVCLEELLEVPFVSAVLFAKLRLLDGGNFQDHSSREEVKDHKVNWGAKFTFPCKMLANASTGVLERCVLRISVRKESKGGRSFNKLGFVDLNLAEYAGAGTTYKKALLEGYDARHRQDNSMLKFSIAMNMLSGDVLFKVPSPSLRPKSANSEDTAVETRTEEYSGSGSLGGSIASGSSGFGSLPKKRPALLPSELVIGQTLSESNVPVTIAPPEFIDEPPVLTDHEDNLCETGHSRNSSNTSQLSKASGYSSIHSHSRQSSSGDSGHIRKPHSSLRIPAFTKTSSNTPNLTRTNTFPQKFKFRSNQVPSTCNEQVQSVSTPAKAGKNGTPSNDTFDNSAYYTPKAIQTQTSNVSNSSNDEYKTPECGSSLVNTKGDIFSRNFHNLQKSTSSSVVERVVVPKAGNHFEEKSSDLAPKNIYLGAQNSNFNVIRSKSDYEISPETCNDGWFRHKIPENLFSFLTPRPKRKPISHSTPIRASFNQLHVPDSPVTKHQLHSLPETRTTSLNSLDPSSVGDGKQQVQSQGIRRSLPHRKLLESSAGGKLAPLAISPDEASTTVSSDCSQNPAIRRPSVATNPSSSSLALSETGSLDRAKAAYERRKKVQTQETDAPILPGRVENTRVNPAHLIEDLLKNTNLEPADDSAETSGLQLFIAKDGTAAVGNHEVKSQMSTGIQGFKEVVMDDNR